MTLAVLSDALQASWPAAREMRVGQWIIRDGAGAGRRASAAIATGPVDAADLAQAEDAMRALPMAPLISVRSDQPDLETLLDAHGYHAHDPSVFYACAIPSPLPEIPPVTAFHIWPPLAVTEDIWRANDIAQPRIDLMHRATCAKTSILGRTKGRAAGAAYVGAHKGHALIHALVVAPAFRRSGLARHMLRQAMHWAADIDCHTLALAVGRDNAAARALYASLGMAPVGEYHYRSLPE